MRHASGARSRSGVMPMRLVPAVNALRSATVDLECRPAGTGGPGGTGARAVHSSRGCRFAALLDRLGVGSRGNRLALGVRPRRWLRGDRGNGQFRLQLLEASGADSFDVLELIDCLEPAV